MKPNFALRLSLDGVEILHRSPSGWESVGSTRFDVPDLDARMASLHAAASSRAGAEIRSKLILPATELRYETVLAPGPTDQARRLQIESEIEGLTPYTIDELAFDWVASGDHAVVVIAAREIMEQAEDFAAQHGFDPVSFVAQPEDSQFPREPFFGETRLAASLLRGAALERDVATVRLGAPAPASPPAKVTPAPAPAASRPQAPVPPVPTPSPVPAGPAGRVAATVQAAAPEGFSRMGDLVRRMGTRIRREQAVAPTKETAPKPAGATPPATRPATSSTAIRTEAAPAARGVSALNANVPAERSVAKAAPEAPKGAPNGDQASSKERAPSNAETAEATPAFSTRRRANPESGGRPTLAAEGTGARSGGATPGGRLAILPDRKGESELGVLTRLYRRSRRVAKAVLPRIGVMKAPVKARGNKNKAVGKADGRAGSRLVPPRTAPLEPIVPSSRPPASEREKATEAQALTIFGARGAAPAQNSFARRGLMLTGGLLLLLVATAVWAVYFTASPPSEPEQALLEPDQDGVSALPGIQAPASLAQPDALPPVEPQPIDPQPVDVVEPAPTDDSAPADDAATQDAVAAEPELAIVDPADGTAAPDPDAMLEELVQEALRDTLPSDVLDGPATSEPTLGDTASMGEAPELGAQSDPAPLTGTGIAEAPVLTMPRALEPPQLTEVAPVSPPPPPPFGTEFNLTPEGLVEATPEGALTPSGVTVVAGRPDAVPPRRPAELAPVVEPEPEPQAAAEPAADAPAPAPDEAEAVAVDEPIIDDTPRADPALAGFRPRPRSPVVVAIGEARRAVEPPADASTADAPTDETVLPADPNNDGTSLAPPPGGVSLAGLRPQQRPTDLVAPAEIAAVTLPDDIAPEAVATSLRPSARPGDLSERVQQMLAAARAPPAPAQPEDEDEPDEPAATASATPQIPTSASVAQQATQTRAINLRRVNLIGVFGTPSDRRALVRLSNGQVVRVGVGDTLDGGRVSAIGDDELRYTKNGRNEVLRIGQSG